MVDVEIARTVRRRLIRWARAHGRVYPWRATKDPYQVLVAQLLLTRTGRNKVVPAFRSLVAVAPNPETLAQLDEPDLYGLLKPLGLKSRVRRIKLLADALVDRHSGIVPKDWSDLLDLPGVGRYAAGAVRCFAFGYSEPLVDGLTGRFYQRLTGLELAREPSKSPELWELVRQIQPARPGAFHYAVIDFCHTVCTFKSPRCASCPLLEICLYGRQVASNRSSA